MEKMIMKMAGRCFPFVLVLLGCCVMFAACSDDDDDPGRGGVREGSLVTDASGNRLYLRSISCTDAAYTYDGDGRLTGFGEYSVTHNPLEMHLVKQYDWGNIAVRLFDFKMNAAGYVTAFRVHAGQKESGTTVVEDRIECSFAYDGRRLSEVVIKGETSGFGTIFIEGREMSRKYKFNWEGDRLVNVTAEGKDAKGTFALSVDYEYSGEACANVTGQYTPAICNAWEMKGLEMLAYIGWMGEAGTVCPTYYNLTMHRRSWSDSYYRRYSGISYTFNEDGSVATCTFGPGKYTAVNVCEFSYCQ